MFDVNVRFLDGSFEHVRVPADPGIGTFCDQLLITLRSPRFGYAAGAMPAAPPQAVPMVPSSSVHSRAPVHSPPPLLQAAAEPASAAQLHSIPAMQVGRYGQVGRYAPLAPRHAAMRPH